MTNKERLINTPEEAIECIEKNRPTSGYQMLNEALDLAIAALEKQEPMKLSDRHDKRYGYCRRCHGFVGSGMKFCLDCGQAINWEEDAE